MVSRLCKHAEGSAFATRKLKHLPVRDRSKSKGQPAIPTPVCKFLVWHAEIHPNRLPQLLVADDVANRHVREHEWWARTALSALSIIHPAGCLKGTGLSHPSHPSLMIRMKVTVSLSGPLPSSCVTLPNREALHCQGNVQILINAPITQTESTVPVGRISNSSQPSESLTVMGAAGSLILLGSMRPFTVNKR